MPTQNVIVSVELTENTGVVIAIDGATKAQIEREIAKGWQITSMQMGAVVLPSNGVSPALIRYPLVRK